MYELKAFHIQLTQDSEWIIEYGYSLAHVMANIAGYSVEPYCWFSSSIWN